MKKAIESLLTLCGAVGTALALYLFLLVCMTGVGSAQDFIANPAAEIPMVGPPPVSAVVTANYNGVQGGDNITYWVVANTPRGDVVSQPATVIRAAATSGSNTVIVSWTAVVGATSYDVIKQLNSTSLPSSCTCAVVVATTTRSVTDNGQALSAFTLGSVIPTARAQIRINNSSQAFPFISVNGPQLPGTIAFLTPALSVTNGFATTFTTNGMTTASTRGSTISSLCTGTISSNATIFMPFQPTGTACTDTSEGLNNQLLVAGPTQLSNLRVLAGTAGLLAESGVVTVRVNGIDTGLSCTVGTATTCSNTSDRIAVVAGDVVTVLVRSRTSDTLANILVSFDW